MSSDINAYPVSPDEFSVYRKYISTKQMEKSFLYNFASVFGKKWKNNIHDIY